MGSLGFVNGEGNGHAWVGQRAPSLLMCYSQYRGHAEYHSNNVVHISLWPVGTRRDAFEGSAQRNRYLNCHCCQRGAQQNQMSTLAAVWNPECNSYSGFMRLKLKLLKPRMQANGDGMKLRKGSHAFTYVSCMCDWLSLNCEAGRGFSLPCGTPSFIRMNWVNMLRQEACRRQRKPIWKSSLSSAHDAH